MSEEEKCDSCGSCGNGCDGNHGPTIIDEEKPPEPVVIPPHPKDVIEESTIHMVNPKHRGLSSVASIIPMPDTTGYEDPMLVSSCASLSTKAIAYRATSLLMPMGMEVVHTAVNDLMCAGADPLYFMSNISAGQINPAVVRSIIQGVEVGCDYSNMTILDGSSESAPGLYTDDTYHHVDGTCLGIVDRSKILNGAKVSAGDVLIGIPSDGIHLSGFWIIQRLINEKKVPWFFTQEEGAKIMAELESMEPEAAKKWAKELKESNEEASAFSNLIMKPTALYRKEILALRNAVDVRGMVQIKSGGLERSLPRMVTDANQRDGITFDVNVNNWNPPDVFQQIKTAGELEDDTMWRFFNNGIGLVVCVADRDVDAAMAALEDEYVDDATTIGLVIHRRVMDAKGVVIE